MGQVTIYLDEETEKKLNRIVKNGEVSKSKWIARLIQEKTANEWPSQVCELAGAWQDLPTAEQIRAESGEDLKRVAL